MKNNKITVMYPITYMESGGAEQQLLALIKGINKSRFSPLVVTLYPGGNLEPELQQIPGSELVTVKRRGKYDFLVMKKIFSLL